jgi:transposase-like protein
MAARRLRETISALSVEFGVHRQLLYKWRDADGAGRLGARRGRPTKAEALARDGVVAERSELETARRRVAELERKVGQQALEIDFFSRSLAAYRGVTPAQGRAWRDGVFAQIQAMTGPQGEGSIETLCAAAGVGRARF